MNRQRLIESIKAKRSFLCVGLDPDMDKIPHALLSADDPVFAFNKAIIDATRPYCVAYKPNTAFYEALGTKGWQSFEKTVDYIGKTHLIIADAKRGDIGNTSRKYAEAFFEKMHCDAITVAPYMGSDSVIPFLAFRDKWVVLLALTSNTGAMDFQLKSGENPLFETVLRTSQEWGNASNMMYVVGATRPEYLQRVRQLVPDHFLLVPGVGAQGGSMTEVVTHGINADVGLLVNAARSILYASDGLDFAQAAAKEAKRMADEMDKLLRQFGL